MSLFRKRKKIVVPVITKEYGENKWIRCKSCGNLIYYKELKENLKVCPKCGYHFRLTAQERLEQIIDKDTFEEWDAALSSDDPLKFKALESYKERLERAEKNSKIKSAIITGKGKLNGYDTAIGILDFGFIGGSLGSVMGEKIRRLAERASKEKLPLIIVSASGGARMQEGIISLMQMAKTAAAINSYKKGGGLYISVLVNPTYGGTTASFAMLGDINIAEKGAKIGFAGPRVIEQIMKKKLPKDFQSAEFLLKHGFLDAVLERKLLKPTLSQILSYYRGKKW